MIRWMGKHCDLLEKPIKISNNFIETIGEKYSNYWCDQLKNIMYNMFYLFQKGTCHKLWNTRHLP